MSALKRNLSALLSLIREVRTILSVSVSKRTPRKKKHKQKMCVDKNAMHFSPLFLSLDSVRDVEVIIKKVHGACATKAPGLDQETESSCHEPSLGQPALNRESLACDEIAEGPIRAASSSGKSRQKAGPTA